MSTSEPAGVPRNLLRSVLVGDATYGRTTVTTFVQFSIKLLKRESQAQTLKNTIYIHSIKIEGSFTSFSQFYPEFIFDSKRKYFSIFCKNSSHILC